MSTAAVTREAVSDAAGITAISTAGPVGQGGASVHLIAAPAIPAKVRATIAIASSVRITSVGRLISDGGPSPLVLGVRYCAHPVIFVAAGATVAVSRAATLPVCAGLRGGPSQEVSALSSTNMEPKKNSLPPHLWNRPDANTYTTSGLFASR